MSAENIHFGARIEIRFIRIRQSRSFQKRFIRSLIKLKNEFVVQEALVGQNYVNTYDFNTFVVWVVIQNESTHDIRLGLIPLRFERKSPVIALQKNVKIHF